MATCFDNLVSLKELCQDIDPVGGIYLNDIGLNKGIIESIITSDEASVQDFVATRIRSAINEITTTVYTHFSGKTLSRTLVENTRLGFTDSAYATIAGSGHMGIFSRLPNKANYISYELASIDLQLTTSQAVDILIYDLDQDKLLDTVPITTVAGEIVTVYPHKIYNSFKKYRNLWIGYDATGTSSIKTTIGAAMCCGRTTYNPAYTENKGASVSGTFTYGNLTTLSHTAGLSLTYSLSCDPKGWLCDYAFLFALAIAHKVAAETYRHGWMVAPTSRSTDATTVNKELMKENTEYHEFKYTQQMNSLLQRIHIPNDSICFECYSPVHRAVVIP